ncbi:TetR/AcrR family transcriptional regulator [Luteococcus sp.]|uniref:TetR/AcrR family transcriptional regulator n=1 Tax=Luteococcus sp. TaxID=1969402 RepID=UPI003734F2DA
MTPRPLREASDLLLTARGRIDGRSARKIETRRRIIAAATDLFAEQGYTGTSMDQIADTAGVSKGTIFYNFRSKPDLFAQLVREAAEAIAGAIQQARTGHHGWEALDAATLAVLEAADRCPGPVQIMLTELFRAQRPWASSLRASREAMLTPLVEIFDEMAEDRVAAQGGTLLQPEDRVNVAMSVLGALVVAALDRRAYTPDRPLASVHQVLMHSLGGLNS